MHPILRSYQQCLAAQVKLDIAKTIYQQGLEPDEARKAYETLADQDNVAGLIQDLAREEAEAMAARGEVPHAAVILLAGYRVNAIGQC